MHDQQRNTAVEDPTIGRFLSADPHVQAPDDLQNWNRYSYVMNNPLSYTDPTGFFFSKLFGKIGDGFGKLFKRIGSAFKLALRSGILRSIIQIAGCAAVSAVGLPFACGVIAGAVTLAFGGSPEDALKAMAFSFASMGAFSAVSGLTSSLVSTLGALGYAAKAGIHGVIGGALAAARGGNFWQGFVGSAAGALGGAFAEGVFGEYGTGGFEHMVGRAAVSAIAGCAGSHFSGGKCANGAVTAAFASIFNGDSALLRVQLNRWHMTEMGAQRREQAASMGDPAGRVMVEVAGEMVPAVRIGKWGYRLLRRLCSFRGDPRVKTRRGLVPIKQLRPGEHWVWSRNEKTGQMGWKPVVAQYSNPYEETVTIKVRDIETGAIQTIVSNRIHPFFVQVKAPADAVQMAATGTDAAVAIPPSSEGHHYRGPIANGHWVDAANLKPGYRLIGVDPVHAGKAAANDNTVRWSEVINVRVEKKPLKAYNITVADWHTFFVAGGGAANDNAPPVWVHNCFKIGIATKEGSIIEYVARSGDTVINVMAERKMVGKTLVLDGAHIGGPGGGKVGRSTLWAAGRALGRKYGATSVIINGSERSTGRMIGTIPRPIVIRVK